jgi:hypothetical protein
MINKEGITQARVKELTRLWKRGENISWWLKEQGLVVERTLDSGWKRGVVSSESEKPMKKKNKVGGNVQSNGSEIEQL